MMKKLLEKLVIFIGKASIVFTIILGVTILGLGAKLRISSMISDYRHVMTLKDGLEFVNMNTMIQREYLEIYKDIFQAVIEKPDLTSEDKESIKSRLCQADVENSGDKYEISKAYSCLSDIALLNDDVAESIRNLSLSIKAIRSDTSTLVLQKLLEKDHEEEVRSILAKLGYDSNINWVIGDKEELAVLRELVNHDDKSLSGKAAYRLNMIFTSGRTGSVLNKELDLNQAFELQKIAKSKLGVKSNQLIDIAFCFNEKYAKSALVTISSILANASLHNDFRFTVIYNPDDPILPETQEKLKNFSLYRDFEIRFIPFTKEEQDKFPKYFAEKSCIYPKIVFMKSMIDSAIKDLDRVLLLDTDLIVLNDLTALYKKNLGQHEYGAVITGGMNFKEGGLKRNLDCKNLPSEYINSGVNLMNLKSLRENKFSERIYKAFLENKCDMAYPEQDIINIALSGEVFFLSQRYNMVILTGDLERHYPNGFMPYIVHHAGTKPWSKEYRLAVEDEGYDSLPEAKRSYFPYLKFVEEYLDKA